jgi:hypothetical protein
VTDDHYTNAIAGHGSDAAINGLFRYAQQTIDGIYRNCKLKGGVITVGRSWTPGARRTYFSTRQAWMA